MSNALTDITIPRPSPDAGKAFRLWDYFSDLLSPGDDGTFATEVVKVGISGMVASMESADKLGMEQVAPTFPVPGTSLQILPRPAVPAGRVGPAGQHADAVDKREWYALRWKIEAFFRTLKTGCRTEELRLATADSLANCIAPCCVLGWRLSWLMMPSREAPKASPTAPSPTPNANCSSA